LGRKVGRAQRGVKGRLGIEIVDIDFDFVDRMV
jgi:hypothetical protein